ncbi:hypothetical protein PIB30_100868 [Stylosanthes scabra]|uniref:Uncharacterized protein n=1 Tax=Stylosanthes scabra TaxID=79078 RepID=A0ABU6SXV7_9FABA|nr:hypothetical protein [Stylosanthes scabra]
MGLPNPCYEGRDPYKWSCWAAHFFANSTPNSLPNPSLPFLYQKKKISQSHLIVDTLYHDGEVIRQEDGIGFVCLNPILCYIEPVETLDLLKSFLQRTMGALGRKSVRRIAYRLLNILPPLEYKFKIFWLEGDVHVWAMFELHRRYGPLQVMELLFETRDLVHAEASSSCARAAPVGPIAAAPLRIATPDVSVDMDSSSEEGSNGEYQGETEESSDSFD